MLGCVQATSSVVWIVGPRHRADRYVPSFVDSRFGYRTVAQIAVGVGAQHHPAWFMVGLVEVIDAPQDLVSLLGLHQVGREHPNARELSTSDGCVWCLHTIERAKVISQEVLLSILIFQHYGIVSNVLEVGVEISLQCS